MSVCVCVCVAGPSSASPKCVSQKLHFFRASLLLSQMAASAPPLAKFFEELEELKAEMKKIKAALAAAEEKKNAFAVKYLFPRKPKEEKEMERLGGDCTRFSGQLHDLHEQRKALEQRLPAGRREKASV